LAKIYLQSLLRLVYINIYDDVYSGFGVVTFRQTDRQTDRQAGRQAGRKAGRYGKVLCAW
jgi:hypothetical protein